MFSYEYVVTWQGRIKFTAGLEVANHPTLKDGD